MIWRASQTLTNLAGTARRNLIGLIWLGLACRILVPVGYMPAPISEGGPIVLCPTGIPTGFLDLTGNRPFSHHEQHVGSGDEHDGGEHSAWKACAFGAISVAFLLDSEYLTPLSPYEHSPPRDNPQSVASFLLVASYQARAPPAIQTIDV